MRYPYPPHFNVVSKGGIVEAIYGNGVSKSLRPLRLKEGGQRLRVRTYPPGFP